MRASIWCRTRYGRSAVGSAAVRLLTRICRPVHARVAPRVTAQSVGGGRGRRRGLCTLSHHLHQTLIHALWVDGVVHVCHDLSRHAPGLQVPHHNRPASTPGTHGSGKVAARSRSMHVLLQSGVAMRWPNSAMDGGAEAVAQQLHPSLSTCRRDESGERTASRVCRRACGACMKQAAGRRRSARGEGRGDG